MPHEGRASGNRPERDKELERSDVACAAGPASVSLLPLRFAVDRPGRFNVFRGEVPIGGVELKSGGWIAFELRAGRQKWTSFGRIRARFAAVDMWGLQAGAMVARLPENRPAEAPQDGAAIERRQIMKQETAR